MLCISWPRLRGTAFCGRLGWTDAGSGVALLCWHHKLGHFGWSADSTVKVKSGAPATPLGVQVAAAS